MINIINNQSLNIVELLYLLPINYIDNHLLLYKLELLKDIFHQEYIKYNMKLLNIQDTIQKDFIFLKKKKKKKKK